MAKKQKLELTWVGKENRPKLEPRILIEDPAKSFHAAQRHSENDISDNRLIFGDNLLALKALEQEFAGKIKCTFIDPPYNTGAAFAQYDDGLEHSVWLSLLRDRLEVIRNLLSEDGSLWITIDGEDEGGVTKAVNWKGGGGFRYYRIGPSLIVEDEWGNPVINSEFNAAMLAEAMCKLEGFDYAPSEDVFWVHGKSTETDSIYVTTQFMSRDMLTRLSDEVGPQRSLLICCSAFRCKPGQFPNLTIKKIPKAVLRKCEWGHDDYSLEIQNLPQAPPEPEDQAEDSLAKPRRKFGKDNPAQASLFNKGVDQ